LFIEGEVIHPEADSRQGFTSLFRLRGKSVLLVEDNPDTSEMIRRFLSFFGSQVEPAENGLEGIVKADMQRPDIILMDLEMPVLNGYEATRRLREQGFTGPIIAISGRPAALERRRCLVFGFDDYIGKPINRIQLMQVMSSHIHPSGDKSSDH
jgi:CheY-like chemotaxis protein